MRAESDKKICPACNAEVIGWSDHCPRCYLDFRKNPALPLRPPHVEETAATSLLRDADRQRIYEEEKARFEARQRLERENADYQAEAQARFTKTVSAVQQETDKMAGQVL